ncbi:MAG: hypothetical protein P4L22_06705 [Candidatus Babeliales bacterium]|nr:hypothetical protein [Candidatus Babeliales bacterium]
MLIKNYVIFLTLLFVFHIKTAQVAIDFNMLANLSINLTQENIDRSIEIWDLSPKSWIYNAQIVNLNDNQSKYLKCISDVNNTLSDDLLKRLKYWVCSRIPYVNPKVDNFTIHIKKISLLGCFLAEIRTFDSEDTSNRKIISSTYRLILMSELGHYLITANEDQIEFIKFLNDFTKTNIFTEADINGIIFIRRNKKHLGKKIFDSLEAAFPSNIKSTIQCAYNFGVDDTGCCSIQ